MKIELNPEQQAQRQAFQTFVEREIAPRAEASDEAERFPAEVVASIARAGYLGAIAPAEYGGLDLDMISFGLLCEEFGRGCASARNLLTVHSMASLALFRWGSQALKEAWGRRLASGESVAAFALSEPEAGSDARSIATTAIPNGDLFYLNGRKKWITFGQVADVFLVFARLNDQITAFWLERESPGLKIIPIGGMSGCRASMLAELHFDHCRVHKANVIGRPGFGLSHVASTALDNGRYSVACGCVGLAQACLEASLDYAGRRRQFDAYLDEHQLVQQMLTNMIAGVEAARLLCYKAGYLRQTGDPGAIVATAIAKYFAALTATRVAGDAVQIHGANGFSRQYPVQRHWRDAKIMEVIEGSTQIQQIMIAKAFTRQQKQESGPAAL